jgi:hypothetical protein
VTPTEESENGEDGVEMIEGEAEEIAVENSDELAEFNESADGEGLEEQRMGIDEDNEQHEQEEDNTLGAEEIRFECF